MTSQKLVRKQGPAAKFEKLPPFKNWGDILDGVAVKVFYDDGKLTHDDIFFIVVGVRRGLTVDQIISFTRRWKEEIGKTYGNDEDSKRLAAVLIRDCLYLRLEQRAQCVTMANRARAMFRVAYNGLMHESFAAEEIQVMGAPSDCFTDVKKSTRKRVRRAFYQLSLDPVAMHVVSKLWLGKELESCPDKYDNSNPEQFFTWAYIQNIVDPSGAVIDGYSEWKDLHWQVWTL